MKLQIKTKDDKYFVLEDVRCILFVEAEDIERGIGTNKRVSFIYRNGKARSDDFLVDRIDRIILLEE